MARPRPRAAAAHGPQAGARLPLLLAPLFFASGAAALVDEVVWTRWLALGVGSSSVAAVVVLAAFMAGLGAGAWGAGRWADAHPARAPFAFAAAEAGIALWSFASIPLLGSLLPVAAAALARGAGHDALPMPLRALLALVALAPPTFLMGATLPLAVRAVVDDGARPGRGIGLLYAANTLGGAAGALAAGFVLIEALGLSTTVALAGAIDLAVAAIAIALARGRRGAAPAARPAPDEALPRGLALAAAGGFALSGLAGLGLEVAAHRILAVLAGSSSYAFAAMLAAVLLGIALGALGATRFADRGTHPATALALALGALALGIGLALRLFDSGAWQAAGRFAARLPGLGGWSYAFEMGACIAALLPATAALGAIAPLVARLVAARHDAAGAGFGLAYAANTAGAVVGALLAGVVLVPALGTARTMTALALLAAAGGLAVAWFGLAGGPRTRALALVGALAVLGLFAGLGADPARHVLLGRFAGLPVPAFREGPVQTIAVVREDNPQQLSFLRLVTNQTSLTGTHLYAQRYMRLLGHLPALYADAPRRALVICLGTGMTAGAVAAHRGFEQIDVAEISPEVIETAPLFADVSGNVLADPRVRLLVEDGRHVLLAGHTPWDVITLEPPPPREAGVVSLYSRDFYRLCLDHLSAHGVVAQWIPLHSQSPAEIRMLVGAFAESFPHALGFLPLERDLILLGSRAPLVADAAALDRRIADPAVARSLAAIGFEDGASLAATALYDRERLVRLAAGAPELTDDRPRVEYFAAYGKKVRLAPLTDLLPDEPPPASALVSMADAAWTARFGTAREALRDYLAGVAAFEARRNDEGRRLTGEVLARRPADPFYRWAAGVSDEHLRRRGQSAPRP